MDKYRPCPSIIAMFTSDSQHPPRSRHAVYLGADKIAKGSSKKAATEIHASILAHPWLKD